jgi:subtilisin family serine protease
MAREGKPEKSYRLVIEEQTRRLLDRGDVALHDTPGEEYFHRPGELLVGLDQRDPLSKQLTELEAEPGEVHEALRVASYRLPPDRDVHESAAILRKVAGSASAAGPHHVLFGSPKFRGCPGRPPFRGAGLDLDAKSDAGAGVVIAVIDTGQAEQSLHLDWVRDHVDVGADDRDLLDTDGDQTLDFEAGHGTFVTGVIAQVAPGAKVLARRAIDTWGVTDDVAVAAAVAQALADGAQIVNLSLGGYTMDDAPPVALAAVLGEKQTRHDAVFVAAAGNDALDRRFYPAALPTVIGVAALGSSRRRAAFSNFGPWVDASAEGERLLSTFVVGTVLTDSDGDGRRDVFTHPYAHWSGTSFAAPQVSAAIAARMASTGESARQAAFAVVGDPALPRRTGLGVLVLTDVHSHPARVGLP